MASVATIFDDDTPVYGHVRNTGELKRILQLPERDPDEIGGLIAKALTARLRKPEGRMELRPLQALALAETADLGGSLVLLPVGEGKTLITYLLPVVLKAERPVLLVRAALVTKTYTDWVQLGEHWLSHPELSILTYEQVSRDPEVLTGVSPDLIIADECHKLKDPKAACTRRVYRYLKSAPSTTFVGLSGTVAQRSFRDYWHLQQWALPRPLQPLPVGYKEMETWSEALDSKLKVKRGLGALDSFGVDAVAARKGFGKRLRDTPGVITMLESKVSASLTVELLKLKTPGIAQHLRRMEASWTTPGGEEFCEAVDLWRHTRELANGFYYHWDPTPPAEWLDKRGAFMAFVRNALRSSRKLDTMAQVVQERKDEKEVIDWYAIKDSHDLHTAAVWLDTDVVDFAHGWLNANSSDGLVWVEHTAVGNRLARASGRPFFSSRGLDTDGSHINDCRQSAIVSVRAIGEGFNLQRYNKNLVLNCTPIGSAWEQMIGRTHRSGQEADNVHVEVLTTCPVQRQGFWQAVADAHYVQDTTGQRQKLCYADIVERTI